MDLLSDPVLFANIWGAIGGVVGQLVEGRRQRSHSRHERKAAHKFSAHQAATQHQREVKDLRKAGLNPILSAGGSGAAAMQGQMGAMIPQTGAVATGMDVARGIAEVGKTQEQTQKLKEEIKSIPVARKLTREQIDKTAAAAKQLFALQAKLAEETRGVAFENLKRQQQRQILESNEWLQETRAVMDSIGAEARDVISIFRALGLGGKVNITKQFFNQ